MNGMKLIAPTMEYDSQIQAYRREFLECGDSMDGTSRLRRFDNTRDWLDYLKEAADDPVSPSQFIFVREEDGKIVGMLDIRLSTNDFLERFAGYVGYSVCPSERRKGYATQMLGMALKVMKRLGMENVLITCYEGNEASRKTIINNGGVYESTVYWAERDANLERYRIDLSGIRPDKQRKAMCGKFFAIEREKALELIERTERMIPAHRGIDRRAYLIDDHAVLATSRLKLRNVDVRDDELRYLDELILELARLHGEGINVVPILGYCYDPDSSDGEGFLIQRRAKGAEMYNDAIICKYEVWTQANDEIYLESSADTVEYIVSRTRALAEAPQEHYNKFIADIMAIAKSEILIDFMGKSNFFYDEEEGFQFIDLDSHTDSYYGLSQSSLSVEELAALGGFVPCHFAEGTKRFAPAALASGAIRELGSARLALLAESNLQIFDKCLAAMKANGLSDELLNKTVSGIKVFGQ